MSTTDNVESAQQPAAQPESATPAEVKTHPNPRIGINENVVLFDAKLNDKKKLVLSFKFASNVDKVVQSVFEQMMTAGVADETKDVTDLQILSPLLPTKADMTVAKKLELVFLDLNRLRSQLTMILELFLVTDQIDLAQVQFENTGIVDQATLEQLVLDQDKLTRIYDNLVNRFIVLVTPFLKDKEHAFRLKLIRQSKDKSYSTLPGKYLKEFPFAESMDVPKERSRVVFSPYELKEGLDSDAPADISTAEKKGGKDVHVTKDALAKAAASDLNPFAD